MPARRTLPASVGVGGGVCRVCLRLTLRRLAPPLCPGNECFKAPELELAARVGNGRSQWLSMFLFPASLGQVMR